MGHGREGPRGLSTGGAWGNLPQPSGDTRPPIYLRRALCNGHLIEFYGVLIHLHATNGVKMLRDLRPIHSLNLIYTDFNVIRFSEVWSRTSVETKVPLAILTVKTYTGQVIYDEWPRASKVLHGVRSSIIRPAVTDSSVVMSRCTLCRSKKT